MHLLAFIELMINFNLRAAPNLQMLRTLKRGWPLFDVIELRSNSTKLREFQIHQFYLHVKSNNIVVGSKFTWIIFPFVNMN